MEKSLTTVLVSTTIAAGETSTLASAVVTDCSRNTQLIYTVHATFNAASAEGLMVYLFTSTDNSTWDTVPWDSWEVENVRQVGYGNADLSWMFGETVTSQQGGTGIVENWSLDSGTWAADTATGNIYLSSLTGTWTNGETLSGGTSGCSATQSTVVTAHALTATYFSTTPTPMFIKARVHNLDTTQAITLCSLGVVSQTI